MQQHLTQREKYPNMQHDSTSVCDIRMNAWQQKAVPYSQRGPSPVSIQARPSRMFLIDISAAGKLVSVHYNHISIYSRLTGCRCH